MSMHESRRRHSPRRRVVLESRRRHSSRQKATHPVGRMRSLSLMRMRESLQAPMLRAAALIIACPPLNVPSEEIIPSEPHRSGIMMEFSSLAVRQIATRRMHKSQKKHSSRQMSMHESLRRHSAKQMRMHESRRNHSARQMKLRISRRRHSSRNLRKHESLRRHSIKKPRMHEWRRRHRPRKLS